MELSNQRLIRAVFEGKSKSTGGLNISDLLLIANHHKANLPNKKPKRAELIVALKQLMLKDNKPAGAGAGAGAVNITNPKSKTRAKTIVKPPCMDHFKELDEVITLAVKHGKQQYGEDFIKISGLIKRLLLDKKPGQISLYKSSKSKINKCIKEVGKSNDIERKFLEKLGKFINSIVEGSDSDGGSSVLGMIMPDAPTNTVLMLPDAPTGAINMAHNASKIRSKKAIALN